MVEMVVSAAVLGIVVVAVINLFVSNLQTVTFGKARAMGLAVANQQLEYLRDLPYDSLATQTGTIYPPGNIPDTQTIVSANYRFIVKTKIVYVDDPYDGNAAGTIAGKPQDLYPYDYKRVEITVLLANNNSQVAKLTTDVAAKAAETASNTGILSIKVINSSGQPVPNATVHIVNIVPNPDVDITTTTDNTGSVVIPGLPPDSNKNYQVTASLTGYSTDYTSADPVGSQTPVNPNANILVQQITNVTLSIDAISTMNLHVVDTDGNTLANQNITITSSKKTLTNPDAYKYKQALTTDASGNITITNLEWGSYTLSVPSGTYIVTSAPYNPLTVTAGNNSSAIITLTNSSSYPTISSATPASDQTGTNPADNTITGTNLSGATIKLSKSGSPDITPTGSTTTTSTSVFANFDLTGAVTGPWDIVITKSGKTIVQTGAYNVTP